MAQVEEAAATEAAALEGVMALAQVEEVADHTTPPACTWEPQPTPERATSSCHNLVLQLFCAAIVGYVRVL